METRASRRATQVTPTAIVDPWAHVQTQRSSEVQTNLPSSAANYDGREVHEKDLQPTQYPIAQVPLVFYAKSRHGMTLRYLDNRCRQQNDASNDFNDFEQATAILNGLPVDTSYYRSKSAVPNHITATKLDEVENEDAENVETANNDEDGASTCALSNSSGPSTVRWIGPPGKEPYSQQKSARKKQKAAAASSTAEKPNTITKVLLSPNTPNAKKPQYFVQFDDRARHHVDEKEIPEAILEKYNMQAKPRVRKLGLTKWRSQSSLNSPPLDMERQNNAGARAAAKSTIVKALMFSPPLSQDSDDEGVCTTQQTLLRTTATQEWPADSVCDSPPLDSAGSPNDVVENEGGFSPDTFVVEKDGNFLPSPLKRNESFESTTSELFARQSLRHVDSCYLANESLPLDDMFADGHELRSASSIERIILQPAVVESTDLPKELPHGNHDGGINDKDTLATSTIGEMDKLCTGYECDNNRSRDADDEQSLAGRRMYSACEIKRVCERIAPRCIQLAADEQYACNNPPSDDEANLINKPLYENTNIACAGIASNVADGDLLTLIQLQSKRQARKSAAVKRTQLSGMLQDFAVCSLLVILAAFIIMCLYIRVDEFDEPRIDGERLVRDAHLLGNKVCDKALALLDIVTNMILAPAPSTADDGRQCFNLPPFVADTGQCALHAKPISLYQKSFMQSTSIEDEEFIDVRISLPAPPPVAASNAEHLIKPVVIESGGVLDSIWTMTTAFVAVHLSLAVGVGRMMPHRF